MSEAVTGEYAKMRERAQATMRDTCKIGTPSTPSGGDPTDVSFTYGSAIPCGLKTSTRGEVVDGSQATLTSITLRVPYGTAITSKDRVQVTHRAEIQLATPEVYAVEGAPFGDLVSTVCNLKRITGASVL